MAARPRWIVTLDAAARTSGAEVGCKATRLADAVRLGLPVPEAFALTASAFAAFCAANGIRREGERPDRLAERIRAGRFPPDLAAALRDGLAALPGDTCAVRSSGLSEDGAACSMAGQLETFLEVRRDDVPEMVKACWAAMFGPAVRAYTAKHGLAPSLEMGVVVQRQIHPRWAGVLFTLDPLTGSADHFVIEWVEGSGHALVSGDATPERVRVSRRAHAVPAGVTPDLAPVLERLVAHATLVEQQVGCPVDIEWCAADAELFLLQARPITAAMDPGAVVWTSTNMSENFPRPLTPFAWSVVDEFYTRYIRSLARLLGMRDRALERRDGPLHRLLGVQGGRVYYNIRSWYELLERHVPGGGAALRRGLDHYIGQDVPVPMDAVEHGSGARRPGLPARLAFWPLLAFHLARGRRALDRFESLFRSHRRALRQAPIDALDAPALMRSLDGLFEDFMARHWHRQCIADFSVLVFPGLLDALIGRWAGGAGDPTAGARSARLLRPTGTKGTEVAALVARMALGVGAQQELAALLEGGRYAQLHDALPAPLRELYADFMERFGSRCYHECLLVAPTFEERPELFWDLVGKYRRAGRIPAARAAGPSPDADPAERVLSTVPWGRRLALGWVLRRARGAIALREQGRLVQSLLFGEVRRLALALGRRLCALGHLREPEDVFYLHTAELRDLCAGKFLLPETLPGLIALRRGALERCECGEPPECFVRPAAAYVRAAEPEQPATGCPKLRGVGASGGRARGTARVILDPVTDRLEPGEILVARSTDPGWTALFAIAGALVLERGGILSHGAIVAREFGVPAVVGLEGITQRLRGGEVVQVDGDTGEVVILEEPGAAPHRDLDRRPQRETDHASAGRRRIA